MKKTNKHMGPTNRWMSVVHAHAARERLVVAMLITYSTLVTSFRIGFVQTLSTLGAVANEIIDDVFTTILT